MALNATVLAGVIKYRLIYSSICLIIVTLWLFTITIILDFFGGVVAYVDLLYLDYCPSQ